jgi:hypothetical protein
MGISFSQLPWSQGAVECALSHLKIIIRKRKEHMLNDLLGALLFLRTNDRPTETATLTGFGALLEAISERERASDDQTEAPPEKAPVQSDRLEVVNARWSAHALELRIRAQTPGRVTSLQGDPT